MAEPAGDKPKTHILLRIGRGIVRFIKTYFLVVGVLVTLIPVLIYFVVQSRGDSYRVSSAQIAAKEKVILKVELNGELAESAPELTTDLWARLMGEKPPVSVATLETALRRAATDKNVVGVFVDVLTLSGSPAAYSDLRSALALIREQKKPLIFHINSADTFDYYLASVGDEVHLTEAGSLEMIQPMFQLTYVAELLRKLGVEVEVVRAGKYKSAMEPLVADKPSEPTLEMYRTMEESLRNHLTVAIGGSRNVEPSVVRGWLKRSTYSAQEALHTGIVQKLDYAIDSEEALKKQLDADTIMKVIPYLSASQKKDDPITDLTGDSIGYVEAMGTIYGDEAGVKPDAIIPKPLIRQLRWIADQDEIKAVVFRISSPGGSALASDLIWEEVRKLNAKKPVVVAMGGVAASGGYYIAAPATHIVAEPTTITGSIGVIGAIPKAKDFSKKYGINFYTISESDRKSLMDFGSPSSAEDKAILAQHIDTTYQLFLNKVAEGRHIPVENVKAMAEGRVYSGAQAKELGLVDSLGSVRDAFQQAKQLGKLNPNKLYPIKQYEGARSSWLECIVGGAWMDCLDDLEADVSLSQHQLLTRLGIESVPELTELLTRESTLVYWPQWHGINRSH